MNWISERKKLIGFLAIFLFIYFLPVDVNRFNDAIIGAFKLLKWYAKEHVILCLIPSFFIAGVITVFVSQAAVIKYFGVSAKKWLAYLVASISGTVLAVCSCTILPMFAGIYKRGAGIGPAITFLYSGPAINILSIMLTARILGFEMGIARVIGAVIFSVVIGLIMASIFPEKNKEKQAKQFNIPEMENNRVIWQTALHLLILILILVFVNWGEPLVDEGLWYLIYTARWFITAFCGLLLALSLIFIIKIRLIHVVIVVLAVLFTALLFPQFPLISFIVAVIGISIILSISSGEPQEWITETWGFAKQILPLLAAGVLVAGFLLGTPDEGGGIIPGDWIYAMVGGNTIIANIFASVIGALMYFATLTEVPILQGLMNNGMGKGPALALLLAGPAISLPNMLVIRGVLGNKKTMVFVLLVVVMAAISGWIYGSLF